MPKLKETTPFYAPGGTKSIETAHSVPIKRMHNGAPILTPIPNSGWENKVVLNPAAVLVTDQLEIEDLISAWRLNENERSRIDRTQGLVVMLYRAQGDFDPNKGVAPSSAGLAVFTPQLELIWRNPKPVITPNKQFHNLGVEDGRCTKIGNTYYFFYTGYYYHQASRSNKVQVCLASSTDFLTWVLHGPIPGDINNSDNKNAVLLPQKVHGKWVILHRPMQGEHPKTMHWATSESLFGPWKTNGMFMASYRYQEFSESWIGSGGPPIPIGDNQFLTIYHQGHYDYEYGREYDLAATILDFSKPGICNVKKRIEPLMRPTGDHEKTGDSQLGVDNVLFVCANYLLGDTLVLPYAGADSRIFGAQIDFNKLLSALTNN